MIFLFFLWTKSIPPLSQDLGHCSVVLVRITLVHQWPMSLTKDHKSIHRSSYVLLVSFRLEDKSIFYILFKTREKIKLSTTSLFFSSLYKDNTETKVSSTALFLHTKYIHIITCTPFTGKWADFFCSRFTSSMLRYYLFS